MLSKIILFGGAGGERMVSTASAQSMATILPEAQVWHWHPNGEVTQVASADLLQFQDPFRIEFSCARPLQKFANVQAAMKQWPKDSVVLLALHGGAGEDGTIQKILEDGGVAFTGSGSRASQICFSKPTAKAALKHKYRFVADEMAFQVPFVDTKELRAFFAKHKRIVIKPAADGSSVGLHFVNDAKQLEDFINNEHRPQSYMAEPFLEGREFTVGVIHYGAECFALPITEVKVPEGNVFDYERKYLDKQTREITPAALDHANTLRAQAAALLAHQTFGCAGYTRTDLIFSDNEFYFIETNTLPGMSASSIIPQQLKAAGIQPREFWEDQIKKAVTLKRN